MHRDHQDIVSLGPAHNPQHSIADRWNLLIRASEARVTWIELAPFRAVKNIRNPFGHYLSPVHLPPFMLRKQDHSPRYTRRAVYDFGEREQRNFTTTNQARRQHRARGYPTHIVIANIAKAEEAIQGNGRS
jgi:hypothetical protein